jgi:hypothetical protein
VSAIPLTEVCDHCDARASQEIDGNLLCVDCFAVECSQCEKCDRWVCNSDLSEVCTEPLSWSSPACYESWCSKCAPGGASEPDYDALADLAESYGD